MRGEERGLNFTPRLKHEKRSNHQRNAAFRLEEFANEPPSLKWWLRASLFDKDNHV